ncbi:Maltose O-acetyltransferase [Geobacillus stearothermophilus]|uniref:Maltose O-acetyltransferase n=1 Tax=Geobacillus stearothermophilus TaxID=1422 RepID=A0A150NB41_GEOSE|nr:Maltose O-acetyltransferase [Geobacillus stearothermophilus]KYD33933.1 Maltose O-acetyltransferase [Geobacillus stearothermophilus]OAO80036.1 Maltose O-acetyltransferase [Geobacillus stearothermophilus]
MKTEKEKMVAGHLYNPADPELVKERERARRLVRLYNETLETEYEKRTALLKELFGSTGERLFVYRAELPLRLRLQHSRR